MAKGKPNTLTLTWAKRYAQIKGYDVDIITKLFEDDALNVATVKAELIKDGYSTILRDTTLNKKQAKLKLADEYGVSKAHIDTIIYNKLESPTKYYCKFCGEEMTKYKHTQGKGVCDMCIAKKVAVDL